MKVQKLKWRCGRLWRRKTTYEQRDYKMMKAGRCKLQRISGVEIVAISTLGKPNAGFLHLLHEKQQTKENNVPYKESGDVREREWEREAAAIVPLCFFLDDCLETLGGSWGKGGFLISQLALLVSCQGPVGWAALCRCSLASQGEDGRAGRQWSAARGQPQHTGWSPGARRTNQLLRCNLRTLWPTAFPRFAFPLTTLVCLSCWTHFYLFSLLLLLILLPTPPSPNPESQPISSVTVSPSLYTTLCFVFILWSLCRFLAPRNDNHLSPFFPLLGWLFTREKSKRFLLQLSHLSSLAFLPSVATWHFHSLFKPFLTPALPLPASHHSRWPCFSLHTGQYKKSKTGSWILFHGNS